MIDKSIELLMHLQTKINDHLELMEDDQYYAVSEFNLEEWWNNLEFIISLIASLDLGEGPQSL